MQLKRRNWARLDPERKARYLETRPLAAARGPGGEYFIIDGHHLALALLLEGVEWVGLTVAVDYSGAKPSEFWRLMQERGFLHVAATQGALPPKTLQELADDPYRSLVARLRRACGCPKDWTPYAEFRWADFLRSNIGAENLRAHPDKAFTAAKRLIREAFCPNPRGECSCGCEA